MEKSIIKFLFLATSIILLIFLVKPLINVVKASLILIEIVPNLKFRPTAYLSKPSIIEEVKYSNGQKEYIGDLYRPNDSKKHPAMFLVYGVIPEGKKDQRLIDTGKTLSRLGYVVFIPEIDNLRNGLPTEDDVEQLIFSFEWLSKKSFVDPKKIGMTGFCYGSAIAMLASEDSKISEKVKFLNSFSGYLDLRNVIQNVTTNTCTYNGAKTYSWSPEEFAKNLLIDQLINLTQEKDREYLKKIIKENENEFVKDLSPHGLAMYQLLINKDPQKTRELIEKIDPKIQKILLDISPIKNIKNLKTNLFLLHSELDEIICKSEAYNLKDAIEDKNKVKIITLKIFRHMTLEIPKANFKTVIFDYIPEIFKFYRFLYQLISRV